MTDKTQASLGTDASGRATDKRHAATPLPWFVDPNRSEPSAIDIVTAPGAGWSLIVASAHGGGEKMDAQVEGNARLIVTAVNHHDSLVEALRQMVALSDAVETRSYLGPIKGQLTEDHRYLDAVALLQRIEDGQ